MSRAIDLVVPPDDVVDCELWVPGVQVAVQFGKKIVLVPRVDVQDDVGPPKFRRALDCADLVDLRVLVEVRVGMLPVPRVGAGLPDAPQRVEVEDLGPDAVRIPVVEYVGVVGGEIVAALLVVGNDALDLSRFGDRIIRWNSYDHVSPVRHGSLIVSTDQIVLCSTEHRNTVRSPQSGQGIVIRLLGGCHHDFVEPLAAFHPLDGSTDQRLTSQWQQGFSRKASGAHPRLHDQDDSWPGSLCHAVSYLLSEGDGTLNMGPQYRSFAAFLSSEGEMRFSPSPTICGIVRM